MMRKGIWIAVILGVVAACGFGLKANAASDPVAVGATAPNFTLPSQEDKPVSLSDYKGKWVVLYFYPKDMTTGCTIEAHNFQRDMAKYDAAGAVILGVSVQDEKSHQEFCAKEGLNFRLLADAKKEVSEKYDAVMNLGVMKLSARHTFLIGPDGMVRRVWTSVDVNKHSDEVLAAIEELKKVGGN